MTIYDISKDYDALYEIVGQETEMTIEQQKIVLKFLEENDNNLEKKMESYVKVLRNIDAEIEAVKNEVDYLKRKKEILENKHENLKSTLKFYMNKFGFKEKQAGIFKLTIRKNQPALKIIGCVPDSYMIPQPDKIDNAKIKDDLKNGIELSFAVLESSESVIIK